MRQRCRLQVLLPGGCSEQVRSLSENNYFQFKTQRKEAKTIKIIEAILRRQWRSRGEHILNAPGHRKLIHLRNGIALPETTAQLYFIAFCALS